MSFTSSPSRAYSTQLPSIPVAGDDTVVVDSAWLRALEERVHTLETALEERNASLVEARAQLHDSRPRGGDLERVRLIVEALRQRVSGDPTSESVLNRVEAALTRLSAPPRLIRPALPAPLGTRSASAAQPLPAASPAASPAATPPAIATATPAAPKSPPLDAFPPPTPPPPPTPAVTQEPESAPPRTVEPVPEDAVPPVPTPPVPTARRGRRWRRSGA